MRHYNIPIFIPELACPNQCVFCNQKKISGQQNIPAPEDIPHHIDAYLQSFKEQDRVVDVAFFGGNFTGLELSLQKQYLSKAHAYLQRGDVNGIRLSTRPDYIDSSVVQMLTDFGVTTVELGAQSMHPDVLEASGRGHAVADIECASQMIRDAGIDLGLQMMLGLPKDSKSRSLMTAKRIIELGAKSTRIYPTLVVEGTRLGELYKQGRYTPLSLAEAVGWAKEAYLLFMQNNVTVLRTGLHPSEELQQNRSLLAGPYHSSFKELMLTSIWSDLFRNVPQKTSFLCVEVAPEQLNYAIGFQKQNKIALQNRWKRVAIQPSTDLSCFQFNVSSC